MPKNKRPVPRKPVANPAEDDEVQAAALATLALALSEREHAEEDDAAVLDAQEAEFDKLLRNALRKRNDEVLYGAIEFARDDDVGAYQWLRSRIEEASATVLLRKDGAPAMEVNAFAVPLFVHSKGGLQDADTFQDGDAFGELVDSFSKLGLESPAAKVVLVSHAYDAIEAARITFCGLNDMARDAAASMTDKKLVATPALERSITGWAPSSFAEGDQAVELRFLVGFALKRADDPFYAVPDEAAAADAYFAARMERYRAWTEQAAPLLKRCLGRDPASLELHFQYQDLFFGAYQQGMDELAMLRMLSELGAAIEGRSDALHAIVGPVEADGAMLLRVQVFGADGAPLAASDKPLDLGDDVHDAVDDVVDALASIGIAQVAVALRFGPDGVAQEVTPYAG
jgi:hypothetical protein